MTKSLRITLAFILYILTFGIIGFFCGALTLRCDNANSVTLVECGLVADRSFLFLAAGWIVLFCVPLIPGWIIIKISKKKTD